MSGIFYQVNEIFHTIQGEGALMGQPSTFIRLQGCSVGCPWCDTKYTWKSGGARMTVSEIIDLIHQPHIVITGGEPTLYDLHPLIEGIQAAYKSSTFQLESSGQNAIKGATFPGFVTWSPKPNLNWDAPDSFKAQVREIKFVVDDVLSIPNINRVISWFWKGQALYETKLRYITLMPEGSPPSTESVQRTLDILLKDVLDVGPCKPLLRYGDRIQYRIGVK